MLRLFIITLSTLHLSLVAQGSLFIIGGGDRPPSMVQRMVAEAHLSKNDHIAILTMSGANPDTSYHYIKQDLLPFTTNSIAHFPFKKESSNYTPWLDSLQKAKLIFITGGVQTRFMNVVLGTPIYDAIHYAYRHGSMIAGTSAGAAVMSEVMITGDQIRNDTIYEGIVDRIESGNLETRRGMGFLKNVIVDQHFIVRSRHNRLLSMLYHHPAKMGIGIDEETAILVRNNVAEVVGDSQVIVFSNPKKIKSNNKKIGIKELKMNMYMQGDRFEIIPNYKPK